MSVYSVSDWMKQCDALASHGSWPDDWPPEACELIDRAREILESLPMQMLRDEADAVDVPDGMTVTVVKEQPPHRVHAE